MVREPSRASTASACRRVPFGEDELAAVQGRRRLRPAPVRLERRMIDLMHEIEEIAGLHAVLGHQPAHRGAVALVIVLLYPERLLVGIARNSAM